MAKNQIIFCSTSYYEYDRRMQRIIAALDEVGYETIWISRTTTNHQDHGKHKIITTWFKSGPLFYLEYNFRLFILLISTAANQISSVDLDTVPACYLASLITRRKLVFDAHEIFYEVPELLGKPIKKKLWQLIGRAILPRIQHCYTVNQSLQKHHQNTYGQPYTVIRNLPLSRPTPSHIRSNNKTLVYLGVINEGRGVELAIEFAKRSADYKLILVGEGDLFTHMKEKAAGYPNIIFTGYQEPNMIWPLLAQAAVGLNILDGTSMNYKYSLANKFFDYLMAGIPSINMRFPEYKSIIDEHEVGLMIDQYNVAALASAIHLLEDRSTYNRLTANCQKYANLYTWEIEKKKLPPIYQAL